ncbi:hypothetical protein ACP6H1_27190 [Vibrio harveyi]|uniref:hypothetical protein n=1 Tax=Vibrio harveyi TaxID=669 RepID=UPI003CEE87ED
MLKKRSYRYLRKQSKVDKAIQMANKIKRESDPLRDVYREEKKDIGESKFNL